MLFSQCSRNVTSGLGRSANYAGRIIETNDASCKIEFDEFDKSTRLRVVGLESGIWFVFTHKWLMPQTEGKPFMETRAALIRNNKNQDFLHLSFIFDEKFITPAYSGIQVSEPIEIIMINGKSISLINTHHDKGRRDSSAGTITHNAIFPITKNQMRQLRKHELDRIGIKWTGTYEEYSIYDIELLKRHANCLKKLKL